MEEVNCPNCGAKLDKDQVELGRCIACGSSLDPGLALSFEDATGEASEVADIGEEDEEAERMRKRARNANMAATAVTVGATALSIARIFLKKRAAEASCQQNRIALSMRRLSRGSQGPVAQLGRAFDS